MKKILRYLRELSVVVVGVAITLFFTSYLHERSEQKNIQQYLNAIKVELDNNYKQLTAQNTHYEDLHKAYVFVRDFRKNGSNTDSLKVHIPTIYSAHGFPYMYDAFETLKASGYLRLIKDEEQLLAITESYSALKAAEMISDFYIKQKADIINELFYSLSIDEFYEGMEKILMNNFFSPRQKHLLIYTGSGMTESYTKSIAEMKSLVEKNLAKLDVKSADTMAE